MSADTLAFLTHVFFIAMMYLSEFCRSCLMLFMSTIAACVISICIVSHLHVLAIALVSEYNTSCSKSILRLENIKVIYLVIFIDFSSFFFIYISKTFFSKHFVHKNTEYNRLYNTINYYIMHNYVWCILSYNNYYAYDHIKINTM